MLLNFSGINFLVIAVIFCSKEKKERKLLMSIFFGEKGDKTRISRSNALLRLIGLSGSFHLVVIVLTV